MLMDFLLNQQHLFCYTSLQEGSCFGPFPVRWLFGILGGNVLP